MCRRSLLTVRFLARLLVSGNKEGEEQGRNSVKRIWNGARRGTGWLDGATMRLREKKAGDENMISGITRTPPGNGRVQVHIWLMSALLSLSSVCLAEKPQYQHGISLLHDLKYPADFTHFDYANPSAPKGGSLILSTTSPIVNFSGAWGLGVPNAAGLERTNDRLFVRSADEPSAIYGQLADGIALSADRKSLFIRLHENARWHDGVPLTTRDLRFTYDALMASSAALFGKVYMESWIESFDISNDRELVIRHRDVFTHSDLLALTTFPVRPAHYFGEHDDPFETTTVPLLGNGPYRITGFDKDHVVYTRVEDYWGRDLSVNRGRYNFDTIRYDVYRDATVAREAFRKGLFDLLLENDVRYWHTSPDVPATQTGQLRKDKRDVSGRLARSGH